MSAPPLLEPLAATLLRRTAELVPAIRDAAPETEQARMVSAATIDEMRARGLFQVLQPTVFGGYQLVPEVLLRITLTLASGCPSTGWVYGVLASHAWLLGTFPEQAQRDVWEDNADALICSATGPPGPVLRPVEGGYRIVDGKFPFSSGCDHADWAVVGCQAPGDAGATSSVWVLVPRADFRIDDTWYAAGLRGTGSKTLRIDDAYVPAHHLVADADLRQGSGPGATLHPSPIYRMPLDAIFPIPLIATAIGAASGAVSALADRLRRGPAADTVTPAQVSGHLRLGHASARLDAALRLLSYNSRELVDQMLADRVLSAAERYRYSLHFSMASEMCVDAVEAAFLGAGGSSILDTDPFQRYWRDTHAAASHKAFNWDGFRALHGQQVAAGADVVTV